MKISEELKQQLKGFVSEAINNPAYKVAPKINKTVLEVYIDAAKTAVDKSSKPSNVLVLKFSQEFFEDNAYQDEKIMGNIKPGIKNIFENFNIKNNSTYQDAQPIETFVVTNLGGIEAIE
jgi:hypothetical protein